MVVVQRSSLLGGSDGKNYFKVNLKNFISLKKVFYHVWDHEKQQMLIFGANKIKNMHDVL